MLATNNHHHIGYARSPRSYSVGLSQELGRFGGDAEDEVPWFFTGSDNYAAAGEEHFDSDSHDQFRIETSLQEKNAPSDSPSFSHREPATLMRGGFSVAKRDNPFSATASSTQVSEGHPRGKSVSGTESTPRLDHHDLQEKNIIAQPCVRPKYGSKILGLPNKLVPDTERKNKKKKKWRSVCAEEMGFRLTLFPRVPVCDKDCDDMARETDIFLTVEREMDVMADKCEPFSHLLALEGSNVSREEKQARRDGDKRVQKAHLQIKSKHITSVLNNRGRKTLYIHFRLYKMFPFLHSGAHFHPNLPSNPKQPGLSMEIARAAVKGQRWAATGFGPSTRSHRGDGHGAPVQDLAHALHNDNVPDELPTDVISFLINLQHREMTPEDYDMLLRLDEGVAPKTVDANLLQSFRMDSVGEESVGGEPCAVCMEQYELGQKRKFLPCGHAFHADCIDIWLQNSSPNCPLDGLPVDQS